MPDQSSYPYIGENTLTFLLNLIVQDFAKKSDIAGLSPDTTYSIAINGTTVTLTGSDGSTSSFDIPAQIVVDSSITQNGTNPVEGQAIYTALASKADVSDVPTVDSAITQSGDNPVTGGAIYTALSSKADSTDIPTVDSSVIQNSSNPVSGGAVYTALSDKVTSSDVQSAIQSALSGITSIDFQVVQSLPVSGTKGVIYLVSNSGSAPNVYDEYIWAGASGAEAFEKIGTTEVDLSGYWGKSELVEMTNSEVTAVWNSVMNPQSGD